MKFSFKNKYWVFILAIFISTVFSILFSPPAIITLTGIVLQLIIIALPVFFSLKKKQGRITLVQVTFICVVILLGMQQYLNLKSSSTEKNSLQKQVKELSDSLQYQRSILVSLNNGLLRIKAANDSLVNFRIKSERPLLKLEKAQIIFDRHSTHNYSILFRFLNVGGRPLTNVSGKFFSVRGNDITYHGTIPVDYSDSYQPNSAFVGLLKLSFNPDSTSLKTPIYYYFRITYSDIVNSTKYSYDTAVKLATFQSGNYIKELQLCRNWEEEKVLKKLKQTRLLN